MQRYWALCKDTPDSSKTLRVLRVLLFKIREVTECAVRHEYIVMPYSFMHSFVRLFIYLFNLFICGVCMRSVNGTCGVCIGVYSFIYLFYLFMCGVCMRGGNGACGVCICVHAVMQAQCGSWRRTLASPSSAFHLVPETR